MKTSPIETQSNKGLFIDLIASHGPEFVTELKQQNEHLREQNTRLDKLCAEYETIITALRLVSAGEETKPCE